MTTILSCGKKDECRWQEKVQSLKSSHINSGNWGKVQGVSECCCSCYLSDIKVVQITWSLNSIFVMTPFI